MNDPRTPLNDPQTPASKPHGTTKDQIANMENEGQAQQPGQEPPVEVREEVVTPSRQRK
jgi:hypothetical protein